jgi:hypothetical protein
MDNEELPEYKRTFLQEMDILRQQQQRESSSDIPLAAPSTIQKYLFP